MRSFTLFILSCFTMMVSCFHNDHDISIQVHNDNDKYEFIADYPESRTADVQHFINNRMEPNGLFSSSHDYFNVDTKLDDGTHFHVKSSPGKMDITIDKNENSPAAVQRISNMCEGIKKLLTQ